MCEIVNIKDNYDIYIGRGRCPKSGILSKWGNPYSHLEKSIAEFKVDSIEEALIKFEEYLLSNKELFNSLYELKNKKIACWCKNKRKCHGSILKKYVDKLEIIDKRNDLLKN